MSAHARPTDPAGRPILQRYGTTDHEWGECHPDEVPDTWGINHRSAVRILKSTAEDRSHLYGFAWDPQGLTVPLRIAVVCAPPPKVFGSDPFHPVRWPTVDEIASTVRALAPEGSWYHPGLVSSAGRFFPTDYAVMVLQLVGAASSSTAGRLLQLAGGATLGPNGGRANGVEL